jgi:hypothetical protein
VRYPSVAATRAALEGQGAGWLYDGEDPGALEAVLREALTAKDEGRLPAMARRALARAEALSWPDLGPLIGLR